MLSGYSDIERALFAEVVTYYQKPRQYGLNPLLSQIDAALREHWDRRRWRDNATLFAELMNRDWSPPTPSDVPWHIILPAYELPA